MATKKTTKAASKKTTKKATKAAKKAPRKRKASTKKSAAVDTSVIDDIFGGSMESKPKKSNSTKESYKLPDELKVACDVMVASRVVSKAMGSKGKIAEGRLKQFAAQRWCEEFVKRGEKPKTCTYHGEDGQFDYVPTSRIDLDSKKVKAMAMLGVDMKPYVTTKGISINMDAIRKLELEDAVKAAIASVVPKEHLREVLEPIVELKKSFYESMHHHASKSLGENPSQDEVIERLKQMHGILKPRANINLPVSSVSDAECFTYVEDAKLEASE